VIFGLARRSAFRRHSLAGQGPGPFRTAESQFARRRCDQSNQL